MVKRRNKGEIKMTEREKMELGMWYDANNDEELLNNAGIGIIMKNGLSSLKKKATYLTFKNNRHEGVLNMLEYLFESEIDVDNI